MNTKVLFSSAKDEWSTPLDLYCALHTEFQFTLDAAADASNTKCLRWLGPGSDIGQDALAALWTGERCWLNPPFSLNTQFIAKAVHAIIKEGCELVVLLLPTRTDTRWFHDYIWDRRMHRPRPWVREVRFLKGRLKFGGASSGAPFPSMIVVMEPPL